MRTGQSLFNELTTIAPAPAGEVRKGRNAELIAKRDQLLVHRYVFYILYTELRPEAVNQRLVEEFHLQEGYLLNIVYSRAAEVRTFRKTPPTLSQLRSWHPHFTWVATK